MVLFVYNVNNNKLFESGVIDNTLSLELLFK